ncbi:MAG: hypothetical protein K6G10_06965 [Butyrivibrio sp.]|nr:hypothetical protein [Butyrivibrio sp.]
MACKIIILKDGYIPEKSIFTDKGKAYILTTESETVPVAVLGVMKGDFEIVYAGKGSIAEYAFKLGELHILEKNAKLYTNDSALLAVFNGSPAKVTKTQKRTVKVPSVPQVKTENAPEPAKEKVGRPKKVKKVDGEIKTDPAPAKKRGRAKSFDTAMNKPMEKEVNFKQIKDAEVKALLKKNKFDEKYAAPIMEAFSLPEFSSLTADMLVRTRVSIMESDAMIIKALGDLIKKTYC